MCEVMERYEKIAVKEEKIERIQCMIKNGCSKEFLLNVGGYTEEEYSEAISQMMQYA